MKKTVRNMIIMLAVLAVLGGATLLLVLWPQDAVVEDESSSSADSGQEADMVRLFSRDPEDVESVDIKNKEDEYSVVQINSGADEQNYTVEGYLGYDLNFSQISANVITLVNLTASKDLGSRSDLDGFGLGSDAAQVTVNYQDGDSETILLGNSAAESSGQYVLKDGTVYIVAGIPNYYYKSKFSYFNTSLYSIAGIADENGNSMDTVASLTLSGTHFGDEITIEPNSRYMSGYAITEPVTAESGNTVFTEMVESLTSLLAFSVVDARINDEKLEKYGLLEPDAKIEFNLNNSQHTITVSAKDSEGYRYMLLDQTDTIYQVTNDTVSAWAETNLLNLRMSYIWITNIKDVEEISLTTGGETHTYHVTRTVNEEKSTDTSTDYDLTIQDGNGKDIPYEGDYQPFYQKLIGLAVFSEDAVDVVGTPDIKVRYKYFDGGSDTVEFYEMEGQNRYAAHFNGRFNGQVRGSEVKAMLDMIPQ